MILSNPGTKQADLMDRLRTETRTHHDAAEQHQLQRSLAKGKVDQTLYVAYLEQMLLVHQALEAALRDLRAQNEAVASIVQDHQFQELYLRADLDFFGIDTQQIKPLEATTGLIVRIECDAREYPVALLGYHYVLEGSNNGSRYIARNVRTMYGLEGDEGVRYLDPYGKQQRQLWMAFKEAMSQTQVSDDEIDAMVDRAQLMFSAITKIGDEMLGIEQLDAQLVS